MKFQSTRIGEGRSLLLRDLRVAVDCVSTNDFHADEVELKVFPRVFIVGSKGEVPILPGRVLQQS